MKTKISIIIAGLFVGLVSPFLSRAQGTAADYKRSEEYTRALRDKIWNAPAAVQWLEGQHKFWYVETTKAGREFILADADKAEKKSLFDNAKLATALANASGENVRADSLPVSSLEFEGENIVSFPAFRKQWKLNLANYSIESTGEARIPELRGRRGAGGEYWGNRRNENEGEPIVSPDGKWQAYIKNSNVFVSPAPDTSKRRAGMLRGGNARGGANRGQAAPYVRPEIDPKDEIQLSFDGSPGESYANNIAWSPDSKKLAVNKVRPGQEHTLYLVQSSPIDQLQPKLLTRNYLKPGDALPQYQPVLFVLESKKAYPVNTDLITNEYSLSRLQWRKDSRAFTFEYNQRGHQQFAIYSVDATTGQTRAVIDEHSKTFIEYSGTGKNYRHDINDGKEIIWSSERDGWNHLYLYDGETGQVKNQITKGNWVVRDVVLVNDEKRYLIIKGSGREAGQDPYLIQYYKVNFDGSGFTALTTENGNHVAAFSSDSTFFVDTYSQVNVPPVNVLRRTVDGKVILELEKADTAPLKAIGWNPAEVFTAKGRDGQTDIWGIIVRPSNFDPRKTYPVIEYIYAGPQDSFVPKSFNANPSSLVGMAELGFIVVQIDGMGTSNRSKAFHDVCWKDLKDAGFPDRIAWMKAAAAKYPYMDLNRVGIYGTSAGGQNAGGAVLFHPEFYKVSVASCGCHDNRMDKMWWNEQWMGYPIGPQYAASSNIENAYRLQGKLMLIVGEVDDNVDPSSTYQYVNALIKANKEHELIVVPGANHTSGGDYGEHKRRDFFVKNLLGVNPPVWENQKPVF